MSLNITSQSKKFSNVSYSISIQNYDINNGIEFLIYRFEKNSQTSKSENPFTYEDYNCKIFYPTSAIFTHTEAPKKFQNFNPCDYYEKIRLAFHYLAALQYQRYSIQQSIQNNKFQSNPNNIGQIPITYHSNIMENTQSTFSSSVFSYNLNLINPKLSSSSSQASTDLPKNLTPFQYEVQFNENSNLQIEFLLLEKNDYDNKYSILIRLPFNLSLNKNNNSKHFPLFIESQTLMYSNLYLLNLQNSQLNNEIINQNRFHNTLINKSECLRSELLKKSVAAINMKKPYIASLLQRIEELEKENDKLKGLSSNLSNLPNSSISSTIIGPGGMKKRGRRKKLDEDEPVEQDILNSSAELNNSSVLINQSNNNINKLEIENDDEEFDNFVSRKINQDKFMTINVSNKDNEVIQKEKESNQLLSNINNFDNNLNINYSSKTHDNNNSNLDDSDDEFNQLLNKKRLNNIVTAKNNQNSINNSNIEFNKNNNNNNNNNSNTNGNNTFDMNNSMEDSEDEFNQLLNKKRLNNIVTAKNNQISSNTNNITNNNTNNITNNNTNNTTNNNTKNNTNNNTNNDNMEDSDDEFSQLLNKKRTTNIVSIKNDNPVIIKSNVIETNSSSSNFLIEKKPDVTNDDETDDEFNQLLNKKYSNSQSKLSTQSNNGSNNAFSYTNESLSNNSKSSVGSTQISQINNDSMDLVDSDDEFNQLLNKNKNKNQTNSNKNSTNIQSYSDNFLNNISQPVITSQIYPDDSDDEFEKLLKKGSNSNTKNNSSQNLNTTSNISSQITNESLKNITSSSLNEDSEDEFYHLVNKKRPFQATISSNLNSQSSSNNINNNNSSNQSSISSNKSSNNSVNVSTNNDLDSDDEFNQLLNKKKSNIVVNPNLNRNVLNSSNNNNVTNSNISNPPTTNSNVSISNNNISNTNNMNTNDNDSDDEFNQLLTKKRTNNIVSFNNSKISPDNNINQLGLNSSNNNIISSQNQAKISVKNYSSDEDSDDEFNKLLNKRKK